MRTEKLVKIPLIYSNSVENIIERKEKTSNFI